MAKLCANVRHASTKHAPFVPSDNDVFDLMLSTNQRILILFDMDESHQFEAVKRLMDIYRLSGAKKLEKFLIHVCIFDGQLNLYLKQEILYLLASKLTIKNKQKIQRAFSNVLFLMLEKAFDYNEYWLMFEENLIHFKSVFKDQNIHTLLKNIIILGFKKLRLDEPFKKIFALITHFRNESYFVDLCTFIFNKYNLKVKNNLLLLQIIFEKENEFMDSLFHIALGVAQSSGSKLCSDHYQSIELNLRLEACDILYLKGSENVKDKVQTILKNILPDSEYHNNPENAHLSSVVSSVDKTLESLLDINKGQAEPQSLYEILNYKYGENEKIKGSLNRIFNYNFLRFSKYKLTLKEIMEQVYIFIVNLDQELQQQLFTRLEQELIDMYDTCSQGYATRLINVFSGFQIDGSSNLGITLSYEDEIYAIFSNKVNNMVKIAPEPIKDVLLEELMVPTNDHENRLNLIRYLRPYLPKIWNEIFEIFKDQLTITDLDLFSRKVTMRYEGV